MTVDSGIYAIICMATGKVYVGSAVDLQGRWGRHQGVLNKGTHHSIYLQNAWNKYGADEFVFVVLEAVKDRSDLVATEQKWLDAYQSYSRDKGYNISPTAGSPLGVKHSAETRAKYSEARRGKPRSAETKKKIGAANRNPSIETREKIAAARRGKRHSEEARARMSASHQGRPLSAETRAKMSASHRKLRTVEVPVDME